MENQVVVPFKNINVGCNEVPEFLHVLRASMVKN